MTTWHNCAMTCQSVTLADGSTVLVNVKPGQKLIPEDIEALAEFRRLLQIAENAPEEPAPGVEGHAIGNRRRPLMGQPQ